MEIKESDLLELGFEQDISYFYFPCGVSRTSSGDGICQIVCYEGRFLISTEVPGLLPLATIPIYPRSLDDLKTIIRVFSEAE